MPLSPSQRLERATSAFLFVLLFVPKANIIRLHDTYLGVKPEDLFVLLCWLPAVILATWRGRTSNCDRSTVVLLAVAVVYVSYLWLSLGFNDSSVAYVARYSLYLAPLLLLPGLRLEGMNATLDRRISSLARGALVFYLILVLAQRYRLLGGFLLGTYLEDVSYRPLAVFSHPTEMGIISVVLLALLLFSGGSILLKHVDCGIVLALNAAAGNRTSLVTLLLVYLLFFVDLWRTRTETSQRRLLMLGATALLIGVFVLVPWMLQRSVEEHAAAGGDASLVARLEKWQAVAASTTASLRTLALGCGVGRFGPAVDGFYVRVVGETGLVGLLLQGLIFARLFVVFRRTQGFEKLGYILLVMLVHSILLDAWYFSRAGYFVWLVFALYLSCVTPVAQPVPSGRRARSQGCSS